jgi:hypothetical protein
MVDANLSLSSQAAPLYDGVVSSSSSISFKDWGTRLGSRVVALTLPSVLPIALVGTSELVEVGGRGR